MQCIRMSRRDHQDLLINLARLGEAASSVQSLAVLQMVVDLAVRGAHWPRLIRGERAVRTYRVRWRRGSLHAFVTRCYGDMTSLPRRLGALQTRSPPRWL